MGFETTLPTLTPKENPCSDRGCFAEMAETVKSSQTVA